MQHAVHNRHEQCSTVQHAYSACSAVMQHTVQHNGHEQCSAVQHAVQCSAAQCRAEQSRARPLPFLPKPGPGSMAAKQICPVFQRQFQNYGLSAEAAEEAWQAAVAALVAPARGAAEQPETPARRPALGLTSPEPERPAARPVCWSLHKYFKPSAASATPETASSSVSPTASLSDLPTPLPGPDHAVQCSMQHSKQAVHAVQCSMQCNAVQCRAAQCHGPCHCCPSLAQPAWVPSRVCSRVC